MNLAVFRFAALRPGLLLALFAATGLVTADAATRNWSASYPTTGTVTIPASDTVILDTNLNLQGLVVLGRVICANKDLTLKSGWIQVQGELTCGIPTAPYFNKLNIVLSGNNQAENIAGMGSKYLAALKGGRIQFHGAKRTNWTRLGVSAGKAASQLTLGADVDWKVGEKIVIASTDFHSEHAEEATINSIVGRRIGLSAPLKYGHWCQQETYASQTLAECAEVGLLSRNITIQGDPGSASTGFGGHVMVMVGSSAKLSGVELYRMGQKSLIARYPMHWHMVGEAPGQYLVDSSIHHAYNRFVSVHGTAQLQLLRNVAYETIGHGYYLEDGIEERNSLVGNLGLGVHNAPNGKPTASDKAASVYWISNPNNVVKGNVAAGSEDTGFWLGFPEHPIGLSSTNAVWPRRIPLRDFSDNLSHSNIGRGLYVDGGELPDRTVGTTWYEPRTNPADAKSALVTPYFRNFTAYKNRFEGVWIRSFAGPVLTGAKLADNWMGAYFANITAGPQYNNVGIVEKSLVVGETGNQGNPEVWETKGLTGRELPHFWSPNDSIRGMEYYDGPMLVRDSLFANFQSNSQRKSGALTSLAPNPFWVSSLNAAEKLSFVNANRVYLHSPTIKNSGDAFSTFLDKDGSISGTAGAKIVPRNAVLVNIQCAYRAEWNAYVCPHEYVNLHVLVYSGEKPNGTVLRRNEGATQILYSADQYDSALHANLMMNRPYSLQFPSGTPKRVGFVVSEKAGKALRLSMPYPRSSFTVTLWGQPIEQAASLAALNYGGHKFYYDGANLHLRLVSPDGRWEEVEVNR